MQSMAAAHAAPRCGARTRSGRPCRSPAVRGQRRCRMHGGTNPGAPRGNRNAYRHGFYSEALAEARRELRREMRAARDELRFLLELTQAKGAAPESPPWDHLRPGVSTRG